MPTLTDILNVTRLKLVQLIQREYECDMTVATHVLDSATKPNFYCRTGVAESGHNATLTFITGDSYTVLAERAS